MTTSFGLVGASAQQHRVTMTVQCQHCTWAAEHRADTLMESTEFLYRILLQHCRELHPDALPPDPPPGVLPS